MKIFHIENGREVAFVQLQDIMYLTSTNSLIPTSIFEKIFDGKIIDNSNINDFLKFTDEEEVIFFRKTDFILDYNEYINFSDYQFAERSAEFEKEIKEKMLTLNQMSETLKRKNECLFEEICNIEYELKVMAEIYAFKKGKKTIVLPKFVKKVK